MNKIFFKENAVTNNKAGTNIHKKAKALHEILLPTHENEYSIYLSKSHIK